jgi:glutamine cyclotransferase
MPGQKQETNRRIWAAESAVAALLLLLLLGGCASSAGGGEPASTVTASTAAAATAVPTGEPPAAPPADAHPTLLTAPKLYTYRVVTVYPHDSTAFTQGLIVRNGEFLEGTGREGESALRRVEIATGAVLQDQPLADEYFGEGITELGGKIYQLTWRNGVGFVYDAATLAPLGQFSYGTEGWGITHDGAQLIVSDGTSLLQFWDPATLQPTGGVYVSLFGLPVPQINELEYIDGAVFANVWQTNLLMQIDPASGNVTGVVDLQGLLGYAPPQAAGAAVQPDVLNGIAYDEATGRLFVTGKLWPAVFEIELVEVTP